MANGLPYYPRYPRDFLEGTAGMSIDLKGPYSILLDLIYLHDGSLPDNRQYVAGQLGMTVRMLNRAIINLILIGKLALENGFITNPKADAVLKNIGKNGHDPEATRKLHASYMQATCKLHSSSIENAKTLSNENNDPPGFPRAHALKQIHIHKEEERTPTFFSTTHETAAEVFSTDFLNRLLTAVGHNTKGAIPKYWSKKMVEPYIAEWLRHLTLEQIIQIAADSRKDHPTPPDGPKALDAVMKAGKPKREAPASDDEVLAFWSSLINGTGYVAQSSINNTLRAKLVASGMVTEEKMRERGIT